MFHEESERRQAAEPSTLVVEQVTGQVDHGTAAVAGAQENGDQLAVAENPGAVREQALPGTFFGWDFPERSDRPVVSSHGTSCRH